MRQELTDKELNTYARQVVLSDIGYDGQLKLRNSTACLIGLGGLGSLIAPKLVGMGIGQLRIVDRDIVFRSDLHRQHLYDVESLGRPKVEVAYRKLSRLNPDVEIQPYPETLTSCNAHDIIAGVDVVLDGLDRPEPRYVVNRTCHLLKIPFVYGAAIETFGNVSTFVPGQSLCLECFMAGLTEDDLPKCGVVGVHPSILGVVTAVQVFEAVRIMMGQQPNLLNKLLYVDLSRLTFEIFKLAAHKNCLVCGQSAKAPLSPFAEKLVEETCARDGQKSFIVSPAKRIRVDLDQMKGLFDKKGYDIISSGTYGLTMAPSEGISVAVLNSGVMIVQVSPGKDNYRKETALGLYRSLLVDGLGLSADILPEL